MKRICLTLQNGLTFFNEGTVKIVSNLKREPETHKIVRKDFNAKTFAIIFCACLIGLFLSQATYAMGGSHPYYLHALNDLREARWQVDTHSGNWQKTTFEQDAIREMDAAINDIVQASVQDGKDVSNQSWIGRHSDHMGRLHDAIDCLKKARKNVNHEEDNIFARGLRQRSLDHIDRAIRSLHMALHAR